MMEYTGQKVIIMLCSSCNIKCEHCYISYKGNRTVSEAFEIINNLKDKYSLELNGAEILSNYEYLKLYPKVQNYLMSNGYAIYNDPKVIDLLKEAGIYSVYMSYHFGIQSDISPVNQKMLLENIKNLLKNGIEFRLMTTITSKNFDKIEKMCDIAYELGARGIRFTNYIKQGNAQNLPEEYILSDEQKKYFFEELKKCREKYSEEKLRISRCGSFGKNPNNNNFYCPAGENSVVLTPDNNIYPCIFLAKEGYEIGKYEDGIIKLYDLEKNNGNLCYADEILNKNKEIKIKRLELK